MKEYIFTKFEEQIIAKIVSDEVKNAEDISRRFKISLELAQQVLDKYTSFTLDEEFKSKSKDTDISEDMLDRIEGDGYTKYGDEYYDRDGNEVDFDELRSKEQSRIGNYMNGVDPALNDSFIESEEGKALFRKALSKLNNPRLQIIYSLKTGFFDGEIRENDQIAREMGISEEEIIKNMNEIYDLIKE